MAVSRLIVIDMAVTKRACFKTKAEMQWERKTKLALMTTGKIKRECNDMKQKKQKKQIGSEAEPTSNMLQSA